MSAESSRLIKGKSATGCASILENGAVNRSVKPFCIKTIASVGELGLFVAFSRGMKGNTRVVET